MIKVITPTVEVWHQENYTLDAIWKHIARCTRVCYQSVKRFPEDDDYDFLVRTIFRSHNVVKYGIPREEQIKCHLSVCEHGTIHFKFPIFLDRAAAIFNCVYRGNKYTRWRIVNDYAYVTTNMRVFIENNRMEDLEFIDTTPNCPYYYARPTISFITDIGVSRELNRHRCHSVSEESTRYCAYDKDKFGNDITIAKVPWITDDEYKERLPDQDKLLCDWDAIDWYIHALSTCNVAYKKLRELGWTAQQARQVLPLSTKTQVVHTADIFDWQHWIALRADDVSGKAHPCIKEVALQVKDLIGLKSCG